VSTTTLRCYHALNYVDRRRDRRYCYLLDYDRYSPFSLSSAHALTDRTVIFGYGDPSSRSFESYLTKVGLCTLVKTESMYLLGHDNCEQELRVVIESYLKPSAYAMAYPLDPVAYRLFS
jgi:hypothetical protein